MQTPQYFAVKVQLRDFLTIFFLECNHIHILICHYFSVFKYTTTRETGGFVSRPKAVKQRKLESAIVFFCDPYEARGIQSKQ
jgi:hypothetical protein